MWAFGARGRKGRPPIFESSASVARANRRESRRKARNPLARAHTSSGPRPVDSKRGGRAPKAPFPLFFPLCPTHPPSLPTDVVKVADLTKLSPGSLDGVQSYVINASRVAFLKRRPQPRAPKGAAGASRCGVCARHLQDVSNFCSLQCKLDADAAGGAGAAAEALAPAGGGDASGDAGDSASGGRYRGGAPTWPRGGGTGLATIAVKGEADSESPASSAGGRTPRGRRSPSTPADSALPPRRRRPAPVAEGDDSTADAASEGGDSASDEFTAASKRRKTKPQRAWLE